MGEIPKVEGTIGTERVQSNWEATGYAWPSLNSGQRTG